MQKNNAAPVEVGEQACDGPERMCVICRRRFPKADLDRHVLAEQGILTLDAEKTRLGRGWYVCSDPVCAAKFAKFRPGTRRKGGKHVR